MDLIFAYLAGLLTLINPCVLPVLPIVLASALQVSRAGPVVLAAGLGLSFVVLGMALAALGPALGLWPEDVARVGAVLMMAFGAILLVPRLSGAFATATAGMAARADQGLTGWTGPAFRASSWAASFWARSGCPASAPRWAGRSRWPRPGRG